MVHSAARPDTHPSLHSTARLCICHCYFTFHLNSKSLQILLLLKHPMLPAVQYLLGDER